MDSASTKPEKKKYSYVLKDLVFHYLLGESGSTLFEENTGSTRPKRFSFMHYVSIVDTRTNGIFYPIYSKNASKPSKYGVNRLDIAVLYELDSLTLDNVFSNKQHYEVPFKALELLTKFVFKRKGELVQLVRKRLVSESFSDLKFLLLDKRLIHLTLKQDKGVYWLEWYAPRYLFRNGRLEVLEGGLSGVRLAGDPL